MVMGFVVTFELYLSLSALFSETPNSGGAKASSASNDILNIILKNPYAFILKGKKRATTGGH